MKARLNLNSISIVLVRPRFHENVGSVARAMKNMGLSRLWVVDGCSPIHPNAYKLASGAEDILDRAEESFSLADAVFGMEYIVGMTSREGKERKPLLSPEAVVKKLIAISSSHSIGLLFGSEKEGLRNEDLSLCHLCVKIPSSNSFPSLNLAQAVMILCYELFKSSGSISRESMLLAPTKELETMYEHMERTLAGIGFLHSGNPNRMMTVLRRMFGRSHLNQREVQILQGIWSQMDWYLRRDEERRR